jgi:hypothetical protein
MNENKGKDKELTEKLKKAQNTTIHICHAGKI